MKQHKIEKMGRITYAKPKLSVLSSVAATLATKQMSMNEGMTMMTDNPAFGTS